MTLARPQARAVTRFPLDRPVHSTVQILKLAMPRNIALHCEGSLSPEVEADENEIQQVVYNLVLNARDAMPAGGSILVTTGVEESLTPIGVADGSLAAGRWATLGVTDSGTGIAPAI